MPRRNFTPEEKQLFADDTKLREYDKELIEIGGQVGGERERRRTSKEKAQKLRQEAKEADRQAVEAGEKVRALNSRLKTFRELKYRRQTLLRKQYYREQVNPLRKKLGLRTLKPKQKER